jgi:hypothetical protein
MYVRLTPVVLPRACHVPTSCLPHACFVPASCLPRCDLWLRCADSAVNGEKASRTAKLKDLDWSTWTAVYGYAVIGKSAAQRGAMLLCGCHSLTTHKLPRSRSDFRCMEHQ